MTLMYMVVSIMLVAPYRQLNSLLYDGTDLGLKMSDMNMMNTVRRYASGRGSTSGNVIALGGSNNLKATETYEVTAVDSVVTGSFGRVEVTSISGDGSNLTGTALAGTISSSGQIASQISGAFTSGFTVSGDITSIEPTFAYTTPAVNLSSNSMERCFWYSKCWFSIWRRDSSSSCWFNRNF